VDWSKALYRWV